MKNTQVNSKLVFMESVKDGLVNGKLIEMPVHAEVNKSKKTIPLKLDAGTLMPVQPQGYIKVKKHDFL